MGGEGEVQICDAFKVITTSQLKLGVVVTTVSNGTSQLVVITTQCQFLLTHTDFYSWR